MPTIEHPTIPCPSCRAPMEKRGFERNGRGTVRIDLCFPCHAIWFDRAESMQLAPRAVIDLFRDIHRRDDGPRRALESRLACPRCPAALLLTHDVTRSGRFSYYRCPADHGRMTPFFQFLREKHFVRSLNPAELARLRAEVRQVHCSGCGAPVDIQRDSACGFCKAPIAVLDAEAVEKALREWSDAAARQPLPSRERIAAAMLDSKAAESRARQADRWGSVPDAIDLSGVGGDLVDACINGLGEFLSGIDLF
jgi:Zn-finger nucleic acid-binding protein